MFQRKVSERIDRRKKKKKKKKVWERYPKKHFREDHQQEEIFIGGSKNGSSQKTQTVHVRISKRTTDGKKEKKFHS